MPTRPKRDVFISYSRHDAEFAERLADALGRHGIRVAWDRTIRIGDDMPGALGKMRAAAAFIVAIVSPAYLESQQTLDELNFALFRERAEGRVILLPALYEKVTHPDLSDGLGNKRYADFTDPKRFSISAAALINTINWDAGESWARIATRQRC